MVPGFLGVVFRVVLGFREMVSRAWGEGTIVGKVCYKTREVLLKG